MKKVTHSIVALGLILVCGCQTIPVPIVIATQPDDAKISVDGTYLGMGAGTSSSRLKPGDVPVGIFNSMQLNIVHPDYEPLSTVIRPKPDWTNQLLCTAPLLLLGGLMAATGSSKVERGNLASAKVPGGGLLICASLCFATFWKFDKTYSSKLARKAPSETDSD